MTTGQDGDGSSTNRYLCRLGEIPESGGKGFWFGVETERFGIFLIRKGERVFAYVNSCPHLGSPLDWQPDRFLDRSGRHIICGTHGALFRIADGFCVSGPCAGAALKKVAIQCQHDAIYLTGVSD